VALAFSSVIRASKAAIRAGSRSSARRLLKFIRRGRLPGNSLVCVAAGIVWCFASARGSVADLLERPRRRARALPCGHRHVLFPRFCQK
jgi:hypothetical protein